MMNQLILIPNDLFENCNPHSSYIISTVTSTYLGDGESLVDNVSSCLEVSHIDCMNLKLTVCNVACATPTPGWGGIFSAKKALKELSSQLVATILVAKTYALAAGA